ncbi:MAG: holo-[acyl-carrier-protein] synthase [Spirochaetaceae bacterium 4572_7]|nr:MAG: holo-[acyl-carrier-protein] synthase [Spirochaetaceae bacterium 4572_7]
MILGIGVDIAKVSRFKNLTDRDGFLGRFFNSDEIDLILSKGATAAQTLAGRFAAREAFFKALGTGFNGFSLKDIDIINNSDGKPIIIPSDIVKKRLNSMGNSWRIHLSISHEVEYAVAQVVLEA